MTGSQPLLSLRAIVRAFGSNVAVDGVSLDLNPGEVHAILGENGAGKTTLMNVAFGLLRPDSGEVRVGGEAVALRSPHDAIARGIGMVHQHFELVPDLTIAENVVLGAEPGRRGLVDPAAARRRVADLSARYHLEIDPDRTVESSTVAAQQRTEILKALHRDARVLILDEPTAVLTPQETQDLTRTLRTFAADGRAIVFISHKLGEVLAVADVISVLRRGRLVATMRRAEADEGSLARLMVGRDVRPVAQRPPTGAMGPAREPLLRATGLTADDDRGLRAIDGVDLEVRAGEILAVAGVDGNGQRELAELLAGLRTPTGGLIRLGNGDGDGHGDGDASGAGHRADVAYIPDDRRRDGLVLDFSIAENLILNDAARPPWSRGGLMRRGAIRAAADRALAAFDIRGGDAGSPASSLSGGNQQKVVIGRELSRDVRVIIANQPTRGLDVGAIEAVHGRLRAERDAGRGVLLISLDLDEVLALADRILVLYEGRIVGEFGPEVSEETLGLAMAGRAAA